MFDRINIFSIAKRINRPLILDGAMGSFLQQKYESKDSLWMSYLNLENSETVLKIHKQYIRAGADIITINTFRTNPAAVKNHKELSSELLVKKSVEIAKEAAWDTAVLIAGSNPPAEDCYQRERKLSSKELQTNHQKHIGYLFQNGCDFILNETQSHLDEVKIICEYCSGKNIPFIISLYFTDELKLLSGEKLRDAVKFILPYKPLAIGFNCIKPETFLNYFNKNKFDYNWGVYFNCGKGNVSDENLSCGISPAEYTEFIKIISAKSPSFVGACCGSSPQHIKGIKRVLDARTYS